VRTTDQGGAEISVADPITRPELDARFREIKTRIWFVSLSSFLGAVAGGSLKTFFGPAHTAAAILGRLI
jgi:hypothetical protein